MSDHTLVVAPNYIKDMCGVAAIRIGIRKLWACDEKLNPLFSCMRKHDDDMTADFLSIVKLIATRAGEVK